jgi:hypothetical protein
MTKIPLVRDFFITAFNDLSLACGGGMSRETRQREGYTSSAAKAPSAIASVTRRASFASPII